MCLIPEGCLGIFERIAVYLVKSGRMLFQNKYWVYELSVFNHFFEIPLYFILAAYLCNDYV